MEDRLTTKNLAVGYIVRGQQKVVRKDLNLSLKQGELTSLLGVNGVGKSTLLRTLAGFQPKLSGVVVVDGTPIEKISSKNRARQVSVVLTDQIIAGDLYAYQVVALGRHPYSGFLGKLDKDDHQIIEEMMENVGVAPFANRRMSSLSDGERQKVMIAKALAQQTPVIILDEPTAFLDLPSRIEITMLLRNLSDRLGKTVLLSTHDIDLALDLSDKLWLMGNNGEFASGAPEDLVLSGRFNKFFERDAIFFDKNAGRFRLKGRHEKSISVDADTCRYFWIEKAMHRNGIGVTSRPTETNNHIKVDSSSNRPYKLTTPEKRVMEFETINELIIELKN